MTWNIIRNALKFIAKIRRCRVDVAAGDKGGFSRFNWKVLSLIIRAACRFKKCCKARTGHGQSGGAGPFSFCFARANSPLNSSPNVPIRARTLEVFTIIPESSCPGSSGYRAGNNFCSPSFDKLEHRPMPGVESPIISRIPHSPLNAVRQQDIEYVERVGISGTYPLFPSAKRLVPGKRSLKDKIKRNRLLGPTLIFVTFILLVTMLMACAVRDYEIKLEKCRQNITATDDCLLFKASLTPSAHIRPRY